MLLETPMLMNSKLGLANGNINSDQNGSVDQTLIN